MDGKAAVDEYIVTALPELAAKTTFLYVGFCTANLRYAKFEPNLLGSSGKYVWVPGGGERTPVPMGGM